MFLTRPPLKSSNINTEIIPCDLHVLNTPPAFILSQNQTLRKKFGWRNYPGRNPSNCVIFQIVLIRKKPEGLPLTYCALISRSAQFNLFLHPNKNLICLRLPLSFVSRTYFQNLARFLLGHTIKELVSRGLKSRSGNCCRK